MNDIRTVEMHEKIKKVQTQYGPQEELGGMGGPGGF